MSAKQAAEGQRGQGGRARSQPEGQDPCRALMLFPFAPKVGERSELGSIMPLISYYSSGEERKPITQVTVAGQPEGADNSCE